MYQWGSFSKNIPGRVGYQCSNYYRTLIKSGEVVDENYMMDEKGELRFNFKNKGFERKNKETGVMEIVTVRPKPPPKPKAPKVPKAPKPKAPKAPKAKKPKKTKEEKEDKDFRCNVKFDTQRRSGRNAGKEKTYVDGEEDFGEEEEEDPVLPGLWTRSQRCRWRSPPSLPTATSPAMRPGAECCATRTARTPARSRASRSSDATSSSSPTRTVRSTARRWLTPSSEAGEGRERDSTTRRRQRIKPLAVGSINTKEWITNIFARAHRLSKTSRAAPVDTDRVAELAGALAKDAMFAPVAGQTRGRAAGSC